MTLIVKKYGGSSLSSLAKLRSIAKIVHESHSYTDHKLVIVLSAMGSSTDNLVDLSKKAVKEANPRDYDCLLYTSPSPRDDPLSRMPSSA